jgi:dUTP pyrophosphatase
MNDQSVPKLNVIDYAKTGELGPKPFHEVTVKLNCDTSLILAKMNEHRRIEEGRARLAEHTRQQSLPVLQVKLLSERAKMPTFGTVGAAGADLYAALVCAQKIMPGERALIPCEIAMAIPAGYEVQVRPRSGLAMKHGIGVVNSPGTIDSDYRGTIGVILINFGMEPFVVAQGDRIAQMVINEVPKMRMIQVDALDETVRGAGGFGSTGTK